MNGLILEKPTTLVDSVEASINNYIKTNGLVAGDRLPSEEEFAESLGVSRNVVREALSRMKSFGMLSSRKKRGIVLQTVNVSDNFERLFDPHTLDRETLVDLMEIRLILEQSIVPLIFKRLSNEDIAALEEILSEEVVTRDGIIPIPNEQAFHSRIFDIAGNKTLSNLHSALFPLYRFAHDNIEEFNEFNTFIKKNNLKTTHRDLLEALKSRDQERYKKCLTNHLLAYEKYVEVFKHHGS
jgi:DNA-binding FadR family transcriptional regulator